MLITKEIKNIVSKSNSTNKDKVLKIALELEKLFFIHYLKIETLNLSKNNYNYNYINYLIGEENLHFDFFYRTVLSRIT